MDEMGTKKEPLIPPDYVSLAQLQERWLQKQKEEKKKTEKEEEEKKKRDSRTQSKNRDRVGLRKDGHEKYLGGSLSDVQRRGVGKSGGVNGGNGKGKQIQIGGLENGEINEKSNKKKPTKKKKKKKKKKNKHFEKENSAADGVKESEVEKEKGRSEIEDCDGGNRGEEVKIVPGIDVRGKSSEKGGVSGGLKGIEEIATVFMADALPGYGVRKEITEVRRMDFRGGFRTNGHNSRVPGYKCKTEYRVKPNQLKETEMELDLEKQMEGEKGYNQTWRGGGRRRNSGNQQNYSRTEEGRPDVIKGNEVEEEAEDVICSETCGLIGRNGNGLLDLKKKIEGEKGNRKTWRGRWRKGNRESYCRLEDGRPDVLKDNEVELESEEKAEDEICSETCGLDGRDGNGFLHLIKNEENNTKEHVVEGGQGLGDAKVSLEKKVDDEVVLVEDAKNEEMEGMGKGYRRYGNWKENINRQFWGLNFNGKARSAVEVNAGERRRNARFDRVGDRRKMKQKEDGMVWVKKEVKPGVDAASDGSSVSGISVNRE